MELTKKQLKRQIKFLNIVVGGYCIMGLMVAGFIVWVNYSKYEPMERCLMYYPKEYGAFPDGVYFQDKYYCVWTYNKTQDYLYYVDYHEMCHNLVFWDREHFFGDKETSDDYYTYSNWSSARCDICKQI